MMQYNTFICYRGGVDGGIGKAIGAKIYEQIGSCHKIFGRTFFAPKEMNYDFFKEGRQIIQGVKYFIIVLTPNFFSDFENASKPGTMDSESATYYEMVTAFQNQKCRFLPVFVYGFDWKQNNRYFIDLLNRLFSDYDTKRLYHQSGVSVFGADFTNDDLTKLTPRVAVDQAEIPTDALLEELTKCCDTIFDKRFSLSKEDCVTDQFRYQFEFNCDPSKYYMPQIFFDEYERVAKECGLTDATFHYWPVELLPENDSREDRQISICAICFGMIILNNWVKKDLHRLACQTEEIEIMTRQINGAISGATNLLVALRSPLHGSWPASWEFDVKGVQGTINQTTLSLSTLLTCGFLNDIDQSLFKPRYRYLLKSIDWLIHASTSKNSLYYGTMCGWGHMEHNKEMIVLPTAFCFDTLLKFKSCIDPWIPAFEESDPAFSTEIKQKSCAISQVLKNALAFFHYSQNPSNGSFKRLYEDKKASISHTAKVQKSLLTVLLDQKQHFDCEDLNILSRKIIDDTCKYLMEIDIDRVVNLESHEIFERFAYNKNAVHKNIPDMTFDPNEGENFENCGELIYIDALIKAAELIRKDDPDRAEALFDRAIAVFTVFRNKYVCDTASGFAILGKRPEGLLHPIYCLYYYRMIIDDILSYLDEGDN